MEPRPHPGDSSSPDLIRGIGLGSATALNMIDMIGIGPFITIPLIVSAVGGPQAMLGWILGALFAMCDGLVWAELGAAMPGSGGSYRFLNEIYNPKTFGRLISFLFIWQLSFSAPMSIASGCIGLSQYAAYFWPRLDHVYAAHKLSLDVPLLGALQLNWLVSAGTFVAIAGCLIAIFLLYRRITSIGMLSKLMWLVVMGTMAWIILSGLTHFNAARAFDFPAGAFQLTRQFFRGMGSSMTPPVLVHFRRTGRSRAEPLYSKMDSFLPRGISRFRRSSGEWIPKRAPSAMAMTAKKAASM